MSENWFTVLICFCRLWTLSAQLTVSKDNMADISKKPAYASPQTPLPTFPISATTLIIFLPIYKFILQKKFFILYLPTKDIKRLQTPLPTFPISATTHINHKSHPQISIYTLHGP